MKKVEKFIFREGQVGNFALFDQLVEATSISKLHHVVPVKLLFSERTLKFDHEWLIECLHVLYIVVLIEA